MGNTHKEIANTEFPHQWTVFVRGGSGKRDMKSNLGIKEVKFFLHPDFEPPVVVVTKPPYEVTRTGHATFAVEAEITLIDGSVVAAEHELIFDKSLSFESIEMKVQED